MLKGPGSDLGFGDSRIRGPGENQWGFLANQHKIINLYIYISSIFWTNFGFLILGHKTVSTKQLLLIRCLLIRSTMVIDHHEVTNWLDEIVVFFLFFATIMAFGKAHHITRYFGQLVHREFDARWGLMNLSLNYNSKHIHRLIRQQL